MSISPAVVFFHARQVRSAYARERLIDYRSGIGVCRGPTVPGPSSERGSLVRAASCSKTARPDSFCRRSRFFLIRKQSAAAKPGGAVRAVRGASPTAEGTLPHILSKSEEGFDSIEVGFVSSFLGIGGGMIDVPLDGHRARVSSVDVAKEPRISPRQYGGGREGITHIPTAAFERRRSPIERSRLPGGVVLDAQNRGIDLRRIGDR